MKAFSEKMTPALHSDYIIDGIPQEFTPAEILNEISIEKSTAPDGGAQIADETAEPVFKACKFSMEHMHYYASRIQAIRQRHFNTAFTESRTTALIEEALIDALWRKGHFRLADLALEAGWKWNFEGTGQAASFYSSCAAAADFIDSLGIRIQKYKASEADICELKFSPCIAHNVLEDEDMLEVNPYRSDNPEMEDSRKIGSDIVPDPDSWIIYIPFDTCDYRLGGSALSEAMDTSSEVAPETGDADYFMDCFELVRELSEDGILLSAGTVCNGGLLTALKGMCGKCGATINISDIKKASHEQDAIRLLFAEVPGAVIQIRDIDFDYIDAEMLLQDVVYYPLGHPSEDCADITVVDTGKTNLESILDSLIRSQSSEGED